MANTRRTLPTLILAAAVVASHASCASDSAETLTAGQGQATPTSESGAAPSTSNQSTTTAPTTMPADVTSTTVASALPGPETCPAFETVTGLAQQVLAAYAAGNTTDLRTAIDNAHQAAQTLLATPGLPETTHQHLQAYDTTLTAQLDALPTDQAPDPTNPATTRVLDNLKALFDSDTIVQIAVTKAAICETPTDATNPTGDAGTTTATP